MLEQDGQKLYQEGYEKGKAEATNELQGEIATAADLLNTSLREIGAFHEQVKDPYGGLRLRDGIDALVVAFNTKLSKSLK